MLTDKIRVEQKSDILEAEDIFADAASLFPDDIRVAHGDPRATVIYAASTGDIRLDVVDPGGEDDRRLFAHYLWIASIYCAHMIECGNWSVSGSTVLELGAGLGLVGIMSVLRGARHTVMTDYSAKEVLENLSSNASKNVPEALRARISILGHIWGKKNDELAMKYHDGFDIIFAADCFWMPWEHRNLARSMLLSLSTAGHARIYAVAGFHTGRAKLAPFFKVVGEEGLEIETIQEVDVLGNTRPWQMIRDDGTENVTERKRWLVVAVLKRMKPVHDE